MEYNLDCVTDAQNGDMEAFSKLYESIYKDLFRMAYYMLDSREDAEDAVSETVMAAYEGIKKLRNVALFRQWVFKILSNKCKNKMKQYYSRNLPLDEEVTLMEEHTEQLDQAHDVKNAFRALSMEERAIVALSIFGGYKSKEIGKMLHMKEGTVRSKLSRSMEKMRSMLQE